MYVDIYTFIFKYIYIYTYEHIYNIVIYTNAYIAINYISTKRFICLSVCSPLLDLHLECYFLPFASWGLPRIRWSHRPIYRWNNCKNHKPLLMLWELHSFENNHGDDRCQKVEQVDMRFFIVYIATTYLRSKYNLWLFLDKIWLFSNIEPELLKAAFDLETKKPEPGWQMYASNSK
jgi:hypothetical protein